MDETVLLKRAIEEIGSCLSDLARVLIQGAREDNQAMRGNIALGLERAAAYIRGKSLEEALEAVIERRVKALVERTQK